MEREIHPGDKFKHFKDKLYQIIAIAYHSETNEKMVVYQALYDDFKIYVRPYDMFIGEVDHEKYPEVKEEYRFTKMEDDIPQVNPILMEFFDKETSNEKIEYLVSVRDKLDERVISDMAVSLDLTIDEGDLEEKIDALIYCLKTKAKYECSRFR